MIAATRTRRSAAFVVWSAAAALILTACGSSQPGRAGATALPSVSTAGQAKFEPLPRDFRQVRAVLARQARALLHHDRAGYLATIDPQQPALLEQQRTLYDNISGLPLTSLHYAVDTTSVLVPATIPGGDPVLRPQVVEHLRLADTFDRPVSNVVKDTFVRRDGHWLLGAEQEDDTAGQFETPQERPWFGVPIAVSHVGDMTVLVDRSQAARLPGLTRAIQDDITYDAHLLGVPATSKILVDATTNGLPLDFSMVSSEEAAAVTFRVTSSDPLSEHQTGIAGQVIKVNPHTVDQVVDDEGIMRHELTHYLLNGYNGYLPKWLVEGIATWVQYYPDDFSQLWVSADLYRRLQHTEHRLPLIGLFNDDPSVNYPISQAAVAWLISHYGVARLIELMRAYRSQYVDVNVDALTPRLLRQEYGVSPAQVTDGAWGLLSQFAPR